MGEWFLQALEEEEAGSAAPVECAAFGEVQCDAAVNGKWLSSWDKQQADSQGLQALVRW